MPLPSIVSDNLLPLDTITAAPATPADAAVGSNSIDFTMFDQGVALGVYNWCWAAVSISVARFYRPDTVWRSKCKLVEAVFVDLEGMCCPTSASAGTPCDKTAPLPFGLRQVGHYREDSMRERPATPEEIQTEIDAGRALCVAIKWPGTPAVYHFVVISAYSWAPGNDQVTVEDPAHGQSTMFLDTLTDDYRSLGGSWTNTYWTIQGA